MTQVKSKQRIADHGEVFTSEREVKAMLDLLGNEIVNISTRFLEPACGDGNFLVEILNRKLSAVEAKCQFEKDKYEQNAFIAISTLYGIELLSDNVQVCRERLFQIFDKQYTRLFSSQSNNYYRNTIQHLIEKNIILGNALNKASIFFSDMKFDVIIGNPPYQLSDEGHGKSAKPIYDKFVLQAKALSPRYLIMIIPSRWFAGGKGLDEFRQEMLNDQHMKKLVDFWDARDCFPNVDIAGGVCYFLWDREYLGACEVTCRHKDKTTTSLRQLNEFETFVRFDLAAQIIKKIQKVREPDMSVQVSSRKPFGLGTNQRPTGQGTLMLLSAKEKGKIERSSVTAGEKYIDHWKVITSKTSYDHAGQPNAEGKRRVLSKLMILPPSFVCTETYIIVGSFSDEQQAENLVKYMKTKFVRFLISQRSFSQDITKARFAFVPQQDYTQKWTDETLYKKYKLSEEEIEFIESMIRPMD